MKPNEAYKKYNESTAALEDQYFRDITPWILEIKPGAKTFEFEGYQESDDEGGSNYYFSSLFIDGCNLEGVVKEIPLERVMQLFNVQFSQYYQEEELKSNEDEKWDWVRGSLEFPEFVYQYPVTQIPQE